MTTASELEDALGRGIRARRIAAGLSQVELAERANVSVGAVHNLEQGKGASTRTLTRALAALDAGSWIDQLAPAAPVFNPLDLLKVSASGPKTSSAPRVRKTRETS